MTKIEWTDQTWNPITGCSRVSEGCRNCYAERMAARLARMGTKGGERYEGTVTWRQKPQWSGVTRFHPDVLAYPLRWRKPRMIFVCSMSDLFHEENTGDEIAAVFGVMAATPQHTYQVLTKRSERMREWFEWVATYRWARAALSAPWPLPNVWLGVSVEDQEHADERIPHLLRCPAAVRFVSYEPALGPVYLADYLEKRYRTGFPVDGPGVIGLDWIIAGGESGPGARGAHPQWFRDVLDQCAEAGVSFFQKQLCQTGRKIPFDEWPEDLQVREWPR